MQLSGEVRRASAGRRPGLVGVCWRILIVTAGVPGLVLLRSAGHVFQERRVDAAESLAVVPPHERRAHSQPDDQPGRGGDNGSGQPCVGLGVEVQDCPGAVEDLPQPARHLPAVGYSRLETGSRCSREFALPIDADPSTAHAAGWILSSGTRRECHQVAPISVGGLVSRPADTRRGPGGSAPRR